MKIVFVILHYLAIDETYKSVDSIEKKIDTDMYKIVIVDNASPDKSGALLKEHYKNDDHVEVLLNQENLGFARGNNVGFRYAEKTWNPSYIVLMNNDVYLLDDDFLEKVEKEYKRSQFAVLGPMILSADGRCDINPIRTNAMSKQEVEHDIQEYKIKSVVYKYHLEKIKNIYRKIKPLKKKKKKEITEEKIYKRRNFTEENKTQKRKIFKPTKEKAKADFYKRQKATQNFLHKRQNEADFLQKRN